MSSSKHFPSGQNIAASIIRKIYYDTDCGSTGVYVSQLFDKIPDSTEDSDVQKFIA